MYPYQYIKPGLFSRGLGLTKAINFSGLLDGTQKTLGVINQAIPIVYQVKPIINNCKTMFRIAGEMKNTTPVSTSTNNSKSISTSSNQPIFYI